MKSGKKMILRCAVCKIQVSRDVAPLPDASLISTEDGSDYLPAGFYAVGDEFFHSAQGHYILNLEDVVNLEDHADPSRFSGCCRLDGLSGVNKVCGNGHEIGTECSDCWMPRSIHISPVAVEESAAAAAI